MSHAAEPLNEPDLPSVDEGTAARVMPVLRELLGQQKEILNRLDSHEDRLRRLESDNPDARPL